MTSVPCPVPRQMCTTLCCSIFSVQCTSMYGKVLRVCAQSIIPFVPFVCVCMSWTVAYIIMHTERNGIYSKMVIFFFFFFFRLNAILSGVSRSIKTNTIIEFLTQRAQNAFLFVRAMHYGTFYAGGTVSPNNVQSRGSQPPHKLIEIKGYVLRLIR